MEDPSAGVLVTPRPEAPPRGIEVAWAVSRRLALDVPRTRIRTSTVRSYPPTLSGVLSHGATMIGTTRNLPEENHGAG